MPYIPILPAVYPDEYIFSWINRIAKANVLSRPVFLDTYLHNTTLNTYDAKSHIYLLYDNLYKRPQIIDSYLSVSTFAFESLFMTTGKQDKYVNNLFRKKSKLNTPTNSIISTLKLCPECYKNDISEYNEPYFHRVHQLTNVKTCPTHKCALLQYNGSILTACEYNLDEYLPLDITNIDNEFTELCDLLLKSNKSGNIKDIKRIIFSRLNELGYSVADDYKSFVSDIVESPYINLISYDITKFLKKKLISSTYVSSTEVIPLLLFLFPNKNELIERLSSKPVLLTYLCKDCNREYVSTQNLQQTGWGCPYCEPDDETSLKKIIKETDSTYSLSGNFVSNDSHVNIKHQTCGKTIKIKPRSFLFEGTRCKCEHTVSFSQAKKLVEKDNNFTLISFTNTTTPITVNSKSCGHTFDCIYSKFVASPNCRICNPKLVTEELFQERIKRLVGNEYEAIGNYESPHKKVLIRHNVCHTEHYYNPSNFLNGQRCPKCSSLIHKKEFEALLYKYSSGRYTVVSYGKNICQISDNKTHTIIDIPPLKAIQEMTRVTPSDLLPIDNWERIDINKYPISAWDIGFNTLMDYITETGTFFIPKRDKYHDYPLGSWCQTQRDEYKKGILKENRINKLNSIGFVWDIFEYEWNRKLEMLKRYADINKCDINISRRTEFEGEKIGVWLFIQRKANKEGTLEPVRKQKLESFGVKME